MSLITGCHFAPAAKRITTLSAKNPPSAEPSFFASESCFGTHDQNYFCAGEKLSNNSAHVLPLFHNNRATTYFFERLTIGYGNDGMEQLAFEFFEYVLFLIFIMRVDNFIGQAQASHIL